jgi:hypothetical protein
VPYRKLLQSCLTLYPYAPISEHFFHQVLFSLLPLLVLTLSVGLIFIAFVTAHPAEVAQFFDNPRDLLAQAEGDEERCILCLQAVPISIPEPPPVLPGNHLHMLYSD